MVQWDFDNQAHDPLREKLWHQTFFFETMKTSASLTALTVNPIHNYREALILGCEIHMGEALLKKEKGEYILYIHIYTSKPNQTSPEKMMLPFSILYQLS